MDCLYVVYEQVYKYHEGEYFHKRSILMFSLLRFSEFLWPFELVFEEYTLLYSR